MNRSEMIELASPPCHECQRPVQRVDIRSCRAEDGAWVPEKFVMVCPVGHRVLVEAPA